MKKQEQKPDNPVVAVLRKLGILRYGSVSGKYTSYKDRPDEMMFENVYDKKKDLVNKKDIEKAGKFIKAGVKSGLVAKIFFAISLILGLLFIVAFLKGIGFGLWFIVVLIIWLLIIWKSWKNIISGSIQLAMMIIYLIVAFIISFIILSVVGPSDSKINSAGINGNSIQSGSNSSVSSKDCNEWVDYTGLNSKYFTFKYPKCYTIEDNERSTWVNNTKPQLGDDHFLVSWYDGATTPTITCSNYTSEGETALYAKSAALGGIAGCERSLTKMNDRKSDTFTLVIWDMKQPQRDWTVLFWARAKEDQDIFRKMAQSLVIK